MSAVEQSGTTHLAHSLYQIFNGNGRIVSVIASVTVRRLLRRVLNIMTVFDA